AIPLISLLITPLTLLAVLLPGAWCLALAHALLHGLMAVLEVLAQGPVWQGAAPPLWAVAVALLGVGLLLLPRGVAGRGLGVVCLLPALLWPQARPAPGEAWVTVLDVGQGLAVLVQTAGHDLLYDTGPLYSAESDAGQRIVWPYLRSLGLTRLDAVILTHRDSDHAGGYRSLLNQLPLGRRLTTIPELDGERCQAGLAWTWEGVDFALLHPPEIPAASQGKSNHLSCVLRLSTAHGRMLLTSDIEMADEALLLRQQGEDLAAEVLLVPHHGSRTSSTDAFLDRVRPQAAVIPVGYRNRFGHPKAAVLARYAARGISLWRTDRDGAVMVRLQPGGPALTGWRQTSRRYWQDP
ncbi:MAG: hypothetical protein RIR00_2234, partial [Pseudomonadota bacterium]